MDPLRAAFVEVLYGTPAQFQMVVLKTQATLQYFVRNSANAVSSPTSMIGCETLVLLRQEVGKRKRPLLEENQVTSRVATAMGRAEEARLKSLQKPTKSLVIEKMDEDCGAVLTLKAMVQDSSLISQ